MGISFSKIRLKHEEFGILLMAFLASAPAVSIADCPVKGTIQCSDLKKGDVIVLFGRPCMVKNVFGKGFSCQDFSLMMNKGICSSTLDVPNVETKKYDLYSINNGKMTLWGDKV